MSYFCHSISFARVIAAEAGVLDLDPGADVAQGEPGIYRRV
jgi:hypothetical protein